MLNKVMKEFKAVLRDFGLEGFNKYYGNYRGFVANNQDPENMGRIQLKVPQLYGDDVHEYWAWSKGMPSGSSMGLFMIPNVGDMVWVEFENGNPRFPIWNYGHFNKINVPPATGSIANKIWQSKFGHRIELDDTGGAEQIRITHGSGNQQILLDANGGATVTGVAFLDLKGNGATITLDDGGATIDAANIFINGPYGVVYSKVPSTGAVVQLSDLAVSQSVKVGA